MKIWFYDQISFQKENLWGGIGGSGGDKMETTVFEQQSKNVKKKPQTKTYVPSLESNGS